MQFIVVLLSVPLVVVSALTFWSGSSVRVGGTTPSLSTTSQEKIRIEYYTNLNQAQPVQTTIVTPQSKGADFSALTNPSIPLRIQKALGKQIYVSGCVTSPNHNTPTPNAQDIPPCAKNETYLCRVSDATFIETLLSGGEANLSSPEKKCVKRSEIIEKTEAQGNDSNTEDAISSLKELYAEVIVGLDTLETKIEEKKSETTTVGNSTGTVTRVGLSVPADLKITGSPITTSGTLALAWTDQSTNLVFAGPSSGLATTPGFRSLVDSDIPDSITLTSLTQISNHSHSQLTELSHDDHTIYGLLAGRSGGQTFIGGTAADNVLILQSNSATSGNTGTNSAISFKVGDSGTTNALTILQGGNVGVGTTAPTQKLHIDGGLRLTGGLYDSNNSPGSNTNVLTSTGSATVWSSLSSALDSSYFTQNGNSFSGLATLGTNDAYGLAFETNNTERMRIDSSGNVGIGTANPSTTLQVGSPGSSSFTDGLEDNTLAPFTTAGSSSWYVQSSAQNGGTYAAQSGTINHMEYSDLILTETLTNASVISFYYNVSSEVDYDFLSFSIDGVVVNSWSGSTGWNSFQTFVAKGQHTFIWRYKKDANTVGGSDTAWVDDITITEHLATTSILGSVGIGTTDPTAMLDVSGGINVSDAYEINGLPVLKVLHTNNMFTTLYVGANAGNSYDTGFRNAFVGNRTGYSNTTGSANTFVGNAAGYTNTTGTGNALFGEGAGYLNLSGGENVFLGTQAGWNNSSGNRNTFVGHQAGHDNTAGEGNVFVGYSAGHNETGSNKLYIDNSNTSSPLIWGDFSTNVVNFNGSVGIGTTAPSQALDVAGDIELANYLYFGNGSSEYLRFDSSNFLLSDDLLPTTTDALDLGSDTARWRDLFLGGDTLHIGTSITDEGTISYNTTTDILNFATDSTTNGDIAFNTDDLYIDKATGNVGVGTTAPGVALDLVGALRMNGNMYANGGISNITGLKDVVNINKNLGADVTSSWSTGTAGGTGRYYHSSVLYNGKMYNWGGGTISITINTLDIYDIATNSWSTGASGGTSRNRFPAILYNGKMYAWAGYNSGSLALNTMDIYDIATNSWSTGATGGTARYSHAGQLYNGKIYYWAGYGSGGSRINTMDIYDIANNSWSTGTAGGQARADHISALYNGKIYFWGGFGNPTAMDVYDIATDSWSSISGGPTLRQNTTGIVYNGKWYMWGTYFLPNNTMDIYDFATDTWTTGVAGGTSRRAPTAAIYNGKIYYWGGFDGSATYYNTVDIYDIGDRQNLLSLQENGTDTLNFTTGSTLFTNSGRFNILGGNIGIGTTAPGSTLDVKGTLRLSGSSSGYVGLAPAAAAGSTTYTLPSSDGSSGQAFITNASGVLSWSSFLNSTNGFIQNGNSFSGLATLGTNDAYGLAFETNNTERIRIDSSGNVGIGTTAPGAKLEIAGGLAVTGINGLISSPYTIVAPGKLVGVGSGVLTSTVSTATGAYPYGVTVDPTGRFAYVANLGPDTVQAYTINQSTGTLTSVGTTATGTNPYNVTVDPTGRFAYVTNFVSDTVQTYTINQSTGALTSVGTAATGTSPWGVVVDPTSRFAYVTNNSSNTVQTYTINQSTGALTSVGTAATGSFPFGLAIDPTGRFAYVANYSSNTVQAYTINQSTGALTSVGTTATGTNPWSVTVDPTGRFAYVTNSSSSTVQAYTINQSTGALTSVGTTATGSSPINIVIDPTSHFAYVLNQSSNTVQTYTINQSTGALTSVGTVATGTTPFGLAMDPTGRFIYIANYLSDIVQAYTSNNFSAGSGYFAGNVGIGTASPTYALDVSGTTRTTRLITPYDNTITVAKSGGDYTTLTAAISAITAAGDVSASNPYTINLMPGVYTENITLPAYTSIVGQGWGQSLIDGQVTIKEGDHLENLRVAPITDTSVHSAVVAAMTTTGTVAYISNCYIQINQDYNGDTVGLLYQSSLDNADVRITSSFVYTRNYNNGGSARSINLKSTVTTGTGSDIESWNSHYKNSVPNNSNAVLAWNASTVSGSDIVLDGASWAVFNDSSPIGAINDNANGQIKLGISYENDSSDYTQYTTQGSNIVINPLKTGNIASTLGAGFTSGSGFIMNLSEATILAGALTGLDIDLSTNVTDGNNQVKGLNLLMPDSGSATSFGVYSSGEDANYFSGSVGIGTTLPTDKLSIDTAFGAMGLGVLYDSATYNVRGILNHGGNSSGINNEGGLQIIAQGANQSTAGSGNIKFFTPTGNSAGNKVDAALAARMTILQGGNVGIGTTTPASNLDVVGTMRAIRGTQQVPTAGTGLELFYDQTLDTSVLLSYDRSGSAYKKMWLDGSNFAFNISGSEKMTIDTNGNVGVGTTNTASATLTVASSGDNIGAIIGNAGTGSFGLQLGYYNTSNYGIIQALTGTGWKNLALNPNGGNVGIGTTNPTQKLHLANGTMLIDTPSSPSLLGSYDTWAASSSFAEDVYVNGNYAFITESGDGFVILDISNPANPSWVYTVNTPGSVFDIYVVGKYVYVADGSSGLEIYDMSNPNSVTLVGSYDTSGNARGVYVSGRYAYVGDANSGLQIIDISNPANPALVGTYDTSGYARSVYVGGKYAYVADGSSGLQIIDISNPASPSLVGTYDTSGLAFSLDVSGMYAYVADGTSGMQIIDISNPASPSLAGTYDTPGSVSRVAVSGKYVYIPDEGEDMKIVDVSVPSSIVLVGTYNTTSPFSRGVYVVGKHAYVADYEKGILVLDIKGADIHALFASNIKTNDVTVIQNVNIGNSLNVENGIYVGTGGMQVNGLSGLVDNSANTALKITQRGAGLGLHVYRGSDGAPVRFEDTNGYCEIDPTSTTWSCTSDARLKKDIVSISGQEAASRISKLDAVTFRWLNQEGEKKQTGLVAQEVEDIFPEFVSTDERGYKSVQYGAFTPIMLAALKEQQGILKQTQEDITTLKEHITSLQSVSYQSQINAITSVLGNDALNFTTIQKDIAQLKTDVQSLKTDTTYTKDDLASVSATLDTLTHDFMTWRELTASNGAILSASSSALLTSTDKTATLSAVTIKDNLQVDGKTSTFNLTVLNKLISGVIEVGAGVSGNEINTSGSLRFQTLSQGPIDFMNGKVIIGTDGSVSARHLKIDTSNGAASTAGRATIAAGTKSLTIDTSGVTAESLIFITPITVIDKPVAVTKKVAGTSFTVTIPTTLTQDVEFQWLVVN